VDIVNAVYREIRMTDDMDQELVLQCNRTLEMTVVIPSYRPSIVYVIFAADSPPEFPAKFILIDTTLSTRESISVWPVTHQKALSNDSGISMSSPGSINNAERSESFQGAC
jgi:hypothetical protein